LTKDDSKLLAQQHFATLLIKQREEFERQHMAMEEKYEDLVKKKETEIIEAGDAFKQAHASFK